MWMDKRPICSPLNCHFLWVHLLNTLFFGLCHQRKCCFFFRKSFFNNFFLNNDLFQTLSHLPFFTNLFRFFFLFVSSFRKDRNSLKSISSMMIQGVINNTCISPFSEIWLRRRQICDESVYRDHFCVWELLSIHNFVYVSFIVLTFSNHHFLWVYRKN